MSVVRKKLKAYEFNDLLNSAKWMIDGHYETLDAELREAAREKVENKYRAHYLEKKQKEIDELEMAYDDALKYSYASLKDYVDVDEEGRPEYVYLQILDNLWPRLMSVRYRELDARRDGYEKDYVQDLLDKREDYLAWKQTMREEENDEILNLWFDFKKNAPKGHRTKRDFAKEYGWSYNRVIEATAFKEE